MASSQYTAAFFFFGGGPSPASDHWYGRGDGALVPHRSHSIICPFYLFIFYLFIHSRVCQPKGRLAAGPYRVAGESYGLNINSPVHPYTALVPRGPRGLRDLLISLALIPVHKRPRIPSKHRGLY